MRKIERTSAAARASSDVPLTSPDMLPGREGWTVSMPVPRSDASDRPKRSAPAKDASSDYQMYVQELSLTLQRLRSASGLSQEAVAHAAGLTGYTYQKFEHGESRPGAPMNPGLKTLIRLSHVFGVSVTELLPDWLPDLPPDAERARPR